MRIGIDYNAALHQRAGIGRYTRELFKALAALDRENEYLLVISGPAVRHGQDFLPDAANFRPFYLLLGERWTTLLWQRLRLPLAIDWLTGPLHLFHSPDYVLPPLRRGVNKLLTIHDLSFLRYPEGAEPTLRWYLEGAVPRSVARADLLLADSESTRRDLIELLRVNQERVEVIYPGVDERFHPLSDRARLERVRLRYSIEGPFILSVGTLEPRKNYPRLIEAFHRLRHDTHIPHRLVIVGGLGWRYAGVFRSVEQLGLQDEVRFLGHVPEEDLIALYNLCEAFAFVSLYEGFGLPVLEAMACGAPVVTSHLSSLPEVAGAAALPVDPTDIQAIADALGRLLQDSALRAALRDKGLARAKEFSWSASAQKLLDLYRRFAPG